MPGRVADDIRQGLAEALAYVRGEIDIPEERVHIPRARDVRVIRRNLGMTQEVFAQTFHFKLSDIRQWERGNRCPDGATLAYLRVIDRSPDAVQAALRAA